MYENETISQRHQITGKVNQYIDQIKFSTILNKSASVDDGDGVYQWVSLSLLKLEFNIQQQCVKISL